MREKKAFQAHRWEERGEGLEFSIEGTKRVEKAGQEVEFLPYKEDFATLPAMPTGLMEDAQRDGIIRYIEIIDGVLTEESASRWRKLVRRKDIIIEGEVVKEIGQWLLTELTGRPTMRPSASGPGSNETGDTSTAEPSSQE